MTDLQLTSEAVRLTNELAEHPSHIISAGAGTRVEREVVLPISNQQPLVLEITIQESSRDTAGLRKATAYVAKSAIAFLSPEWIQALLTTVIRSPGHFWLDKVGSPVKNIRIQQEIGISDICSATVFTDISIRRQDT